MNNQDILRPMFSYSLVPIFLFMIIIGTLLFFLLKGKKNTDTPKIVKPSPNKLLSIQDIYIQEINKIEQDYQNNKITKRAAYQKLSILIRNYIFEVTKIKVQNYSLQEIKKVGIPVLSFLVEEYYHPEFAKESDIDITESFEKTREAIKKW